MRRLFSLNAGCTRWRRRRRSKGTSHGGLRAEHELESRLPLVLVHAGLREAHRLDVGVTADLAGPPLARDLGCRVAQPKVVQERARVLDAHGRGEAAAAGRPQIGHQPDHA
jgi:hypothetical protein